MTIAAMRSALGDNLRTISGLRVSEEMPDQISPPIAVVSLGSIDYHGAMGGGLTTYQFTVQVVVGRMSERNAQRTLDAYVFPTGASSVPSAIESERTLNGSCQDLIVSGMPNIGSLTVNENQYLAAEFAVTVYA